MWLLILTFSAIFATAIWYSRAEDDRYMLKPLSAMLWGAAIMVFIDHVMGYLMEGGEFLDLSPEAAALGFSLLAAALAIWQAILLIKDPKRVWRKG